MSQYDYLYTPLAPPPQADPNQYNFSFSPSPVIYTPPDYGWTPPTYTFTPPDYSFNFTPPSLSGLYSPPDYLSSLYSPPDYLSSLYSPPDYLSSLYSPPSLYSNLYTFDSLNSPYVSPYSSSSSVLFGDDPLNSIYSPETVYQELQHKWDATHFDDPYGITSADPIASARDWGILQDAKSAAILAGFMPDDAGGSSASYDMYNGISDPAAYDWGTDADYSSGYIPDINTGYFSQPDYSSYTPDISSYGVQIADASRYSNPGAINDISAAQDFALLQQAQQAPVLSNESGASSGIGVTPLEDGALVTRPDGSTLKLDNEQFSQLMAGDNSVLSGRNVESSTAEEFGGTTNIAKEGTTLNLEGDNIYKDAIDRDTIARNNEALGRVGQQETPYTPTGGNERTYDLGETPAVEGTGIKGPGKDAVYAGNYDLVPERASVPGAGIDPTRVRADGGQGIVVSGKTANEALIPEDLRKYGFDPDKQYALDKNGKVSPAYEKALDAMGKEDPGFFENLWNKLRMSMSANKTSGGGGGGGKSKDPAKNNANNALLMALLAYLASKGGNLNSNSPMIAPSSSGFGLTKNTLDTTGRRAGSNALSYFSSPGTVKKAEGGITSLSANPLGGYSDGGRLLRGPGDGVSDSIPATIGKKQPARLADGEFVVPARIVSELGNGSTEAGARKLYAMMDRVQKARKKTVGKGKVAHNSRADKYLPK